MSVKVILASLILAWTCTTCSAGAHTDACDPTTDMLGQNEVIATVVSNSNLKVDGPETDVEAIAAAAMGMYDRAAEEQAVPTAAQLKAMDRAFQDAENKVNLVAPLKYERALQLRKLLADVLDRLIWGGSLLAIGLGLSSLASRFKRSSRVLTSVSMVLLGCAYALLLPIIAVGVVVAWLFFRRAFTPTLISTSTAGSAHAQVVKVVATAAAR
jgi:hypothetical protein